MLAWLPLIKCLDRCVDQFEASTSPWVTPLAFELLKVGSFNYRPFPHPQAKTVFLMPFQVLDLIVNFFVIKERIINREFLKASLSKPFAHKCKLFTFELLFIKR